MFSEERLKILPRWFKGSEWADGTAECESLAEYHAAEMREQSVENAKSPEQRKADRIASEKRKFQKWFQWKLSQEG